MLGGDGDRLAQTERVGLVDSNIAGFAFSLVGAEDDGLVGAAQQGGEGSIQRQHAGAGVDQKQNDVGVADGGFGLGAHACFKRGVGRILEAGGVDQREVEIAQAALGFAPVARDAGRVIDDRKLPAREPIEER